jgi:hypothetical protein
MFGRTTDAGAVRLYDRTHNPNVIIGFTAYAAQSLTRAFNATSTILEWEPVPRVAELCSWLQNVADSLAADKPG